MATKNVAYNEYKISKTYTVTAYLTIKAVSERHAEDIAQEFDCSCGLDSVFFGVNDEHITEFDLDVDFFDKGCAEKYETKIDTTEEDCDCLDDDADMLFDVYGEDSDFDYEDIEVEEDDEESEEIESEETESEETESEEDFSFDENPPFTAQEPPKVQLNFLAKSDSITWDLTVERLIERLKELPPNATVSLHIFSNDIAIGDMVAHIK